MMMPNSAPPSLNGPNPFAGGHSALRIGANDTMTRDTTSHESNMNTMDQTGMMSHNLDSCTVESTWFVRTHIDSAGVDFDHVLCP